MAEQDDPIAGTVREATLRLMRELGVRRCSIDGSRVELSFWRPEPAVSMSPQSRRRAVDPAVERRRLALASTDYEYHVPPDDGESD